MTSEPENTAGTIKAVDEVVDIVSKLIRFDTSNTGEPETTKGEVLHYYAAVAPRLLPQMAGRPVTRVRFPHGVGDLNFFEKNVPGIGVGREGFTWQGVQTISMKREWPSWRPPAASAPFTRPATRWAAATARSPPAAAASRPRWPRRSHCGRWRPERGNDEQEKTRITPL